MPQEPDTLDCHAPSIFNISQLSGKVLKEKINVIWIASYPKSGNTWIHHVLRVAGKTRGFPQGDMDVYNIAGGRSELVICDAVASRFSNIPCVVLKTHAKFRDGGQLHCIENVDLINAAFIHITRNPLDVLLSYLNFTRLEYPHFSKDAAYQRNLFVDLLGMDAPYDCNQWMEFSIDVIPQRNLDYALDAFSEKSMVLKQCEPMSGGWIENTRSWFDAANVFPGYCVRYEDCFGDAEEIVKLCELFKFTRSDALIAFDIVNAQTLAKAQNGDVFYNKMRPCYFPGYFSKSAIDRFFAKNEQVLKQFGYEDLLKVG